MAENLINNMGLREEVLQQATTDGQLDTTNASMEQVRKVRPELLTQDPALLKRMPNGGKDNANMDESEYITQMLGALSGEYADDEAMSGMTGGQRIEQLMRKHPKQLDNFFGEVGRLQQGKADASMQSSSNLIDKITQSDSDEVDYLGNRVRTSETGDAFSGWESREEFKTRKGR